MLILANICFGQMHQENVSIEDSAAWGNIGCEVLRVRDMVNGLDKNKDKTL